MGRTAKPQFHWSHMVELEMCGHRYHLRYEQGRSAPAGTAAIVGTAVHDVAAQALRHRAETGDTLDALDVGERARDAVSVAWGGGVQLVGDEVDAGIDATRDRCRDQASAMAAEYQRRIEPTIRPKADGIERQWVIEVDGFPFNLAGTWDVDEDALVRDGVMVAPSSVRDLKTKQNRRPSSDFVATSGQLTMYAIAREAVTGEYPDRVFLDYVTRTRAGAVDAGSFGSVRAEVHAIAFWNRLEQHARILEAGVFTPARPYEDWYCSEKWCPFARPDPETGEPACRYFAKAPTFVALRFNQQEKPHARSKRATDEQRRRLADELSG